jgi:hypothetical protein
MDMQDKFCYGISLEEKCLCKIVICNYMQVAMNINN